MTPKDELPGIQHVCVGPQLLVDDAAQGRRIHGERQPAGGNEPRQPLEPLGHALLRSEAWFGRRQRGHGKQGNKQ